MSVRGYHRTTAAAGDTIVRGGFRDAEGSYGTGDIHRGVWVTIGRPWDLVIDGPPLGDDPVLLVIEIPFGLFASHEWVEAGKGYREALIPAELLNAYPVWRAWECVECDAIAPEGTAGWCTELLVAPTGDKMRMSTCPDCV